MKKILSALVLISLLAVLLAPMVASAQEEIPEKCTIHRNFSYDGKDYKSGGEVTSDNADWGIICLLNTVYRVTDLMFVILLAVAIIFVLIGALTIMMAGGDPERVKRGRDYILYAVIGLIVAFLARAIPALIKTVM